MSLDVWIARVTRPGRPKRLCGSRVYDTKPEMRRSVAQLYARYGREYVEVWQIEDGQAIKEEFPLDND